MKAIIKLVPVVIMGGMIAAGYDVLVAAPIASVVAILLAVVLDKMKIQDVMDAAMEGAKESVLPCFILMLAYALSAVFMSSGVGAAAIGLFLNLGVTSKTVAVVSFLAACVISVSTGTSWGTVACCLPIFMWLCDITSGSAALTFASIIGGACFGDSLGLISDTTILSSSIQGVEAVDRVRYQFVWSLLCVAIATVCIYITGPSPAAGAQSSSGLVIFEHLSEETIAVLQEKRPAVITLLNQVQEGISPVMMLPIILVIAMAIAKIPTIICMVSGIIVASAMGLLMGRLESLNAVFDIVIEGFGDAGSWAVILMIWVMAFGGVMKAMNAFDPIGKLFLRCSKNVRTLITLNGLLAIIGNMALAEDNSEIATIGPVIKQIVEENVETDEKGMYDLKIRNALFTSNMGVNGMVLIPWHTTLAYFMGLVSAVYPLYHFQVRDLYINYFSIISVVSLFILTFTGLDRFIPGMRLPSEPKARLRRERLTNNG